MARFRPPATLIGLSPDPATVRAMALSWGVRALEVGTYHSTDDLVWFAVERAVQSGLVKPGDTVLVLAGAPDRPGGASTDVLRIVRVS
jgi:pyruvate kinase